eukprot:9342-Eustigmatos_ZCMA.PRE.1
MEHTRQQDRYRAIGASATSIRRMTARYTQDGLRRNVDLHFDSCSLMYAHEGCMGCRRVTHQ